MEPSEILGPEKLIEIDRALSEIKRGLSAATLAERAGIDVSDQRRQLEESEARLRRIKSVFFPGA